MINMIPHADLKDSKEIGRKFLLQEMRGKRPKRNAEEHEKGGKNYE